MYNRAQFDAAVVELAKVLEADPDNLHAHVLMGAIGVKSGRFDQAEPHLHAALRIQPRQIDALLFFATMRRMQDRPDEAADFARLAVNAEPNNPMLLNTLGMSLLELNRTAEAIDVLGRAAALNPNSAQAHFNLGIALSKDARPADAVIALRNAIRLAPDMTNAYVELYRQFDWLGRWKEAIALLKPAVARRPDSVVLLLTLAKAHAKLNETQEAERRFKQAMRLDPSSAQHYGLWLQESGLFEESVEYLRQSVRLNPNQGLAYYYISEAKVFETPEGSLNDLVAQVNEVPLDPEARMCLAYTRARCQDRAGNFEAAMQQYDIANSLAFQIYVASRAYNTAEARQRTAELRAFWNPDYLASLRQRATAGDAPILIVGMIRSGTTLLDQILSSHPMVASAGEQSFWNLRIRSLENSLRASVTENKKLDMLAKELRGLAQDYVSDLRRAAGDAVRFTDKMPLNYLHLGLISAALPGAKFIHVRRSPIDTCLSIYMTHYGRGPEWAYNRENILANYRDYQEVMAFWRCVLPEGQLCEIDYEAIVDDREGVIRSVLQFCGLPWDDAVLHHEENTAVVTTPSRWQARQPIYRSSVGRWRKYEPWLGAFAELVPD